MQLHDYQLRAIDFIQEHKAVYLAIDMGLGKTAICLKFIQQTGQRAIVFAPLRAAQSTWPDEIRKWTPELTYRVLHGKDKSLDSIDDIDILIINYEGIKWFASQKVRWKRRALILDESSKLKSHSTARFKTIRSMSNLWTDIRLCLSATPAPNGLHELWSQYYILDGGRALGRNISAFRDEFCRSFSYPGMVFTKYEVEPSKVQGIYDQVAPRTFRLKAEDYLEMPELTYNTISCKMTPKLTKEYKTLEDEFFLELDDAEIEAPNTAQLSMKLRQFVQGGLYYDDEEFKRQWTEIHQIKLDALADMIDTSAGQPILCAIQFRFELEMVQKRFGKIPVIAGGTSGKQASTYIRQWNEGGIPLLLCHPASLSHGVNLQAGGHILLWYGLTWSLEQYIQLTGRLYRQGQKAGVVVHHLVMENTVDEAVMTALANKNTGQEAMLDYLKAYHNKRG